MVVVLPLLVLVVLVGMPGEAQGASEPPWATGRSNPEDLRIKLVTFGPGPDVASWFGHSALVVEDTRLKHSRLYNYGMFTFDGTLLVKFASGRLEFWVGQQPETPTYEMYKRSGRDVRIQILNLTPRKRQELASHLAWKVRPDNRTYLYDHYDDNCATRPRDLVDEAVDGALYEATQETSPWTLREHTRRYSAHNLWMELLMMFLMNDDIDQPIPEWDAMFLPPQLEQHVADLSYERADGEVVPLVKEQIVYHESTVDREVPAAPPVHWPWTLGLGLLAGLGAMGAAQWRSVSDTRNSRVGFGLYNAWIGLFVGLPGLGLALMALFTDHTLTYWNENLLLANPLSFAALPLGVAIAFGSTRAVRWLRWIWAILAATGALAVVVKVLPMFDQQNWLSISLMWPISLGFAAAYWLLLPRPKT